MMSRRKGISTLIGTVLVLLVTITVVSVFSSWAPNLVQDITTTTENQTMNQVDCNKADLEVLSAEYNKSGDNNVTVVVRNKGNIKLDNIRLEAWADELPLNSTTASDLEPADYITKNITDVDEKPATIETISVECGNAQDEFDDIS